MSPEILAIFGRYHWPGNVRELKNLIERVVITTDEHHIAPEMLPSDFLWHFQEPQQTMTLSQARRAAEAEAILKAIYQTKGDRAKAASILDISPRTLRHKIQHYNLRIKPDGQPAQ